MKNQNIPDTRELTKIEDGEDLKSLVANSTKSLEFANALSIITEQDFELANSNLADIKAEIDNGDKARKFLGDPYRMLVEKINGFFMPPIKTLQQASIIISRKMVTWHTEQEEKARKEREKLAKKVEAGKLNAEKAAEKAEMIVAPAKTIQSPFTGAQTTFRIRKVLEIFDESKLPREYLIPDKIKIDKILRAGVEVPGARLIDSKVVSNTRNSF